MKGGNLSVEHLLFEELRCHISVEPPSVYVFPSRKKQNGTFVIHSIFCGTLRYLQFNKADM